MNNEETIVMQPQGDNQKAGKSQKISSKKRKIATTAAAGVMGGVVGGGATYAATGLHHDDTTHEPATDENSQPEEATSAEQDTESQVEQHNEPQATEVVAEADDATANSEPDYTGQHGDDPFVADTNVHVAVDESDSTPNEVQVLGIYEAEGDQGQTMQAAMLTNGQEVAAVVDVDGDGFVDIMAIDTNHNQQIDEGEVYDVSAENISMQPYEDQYIAQQQEQIQQEQIQQEQVQQEHDLMAHDAGYEQDDYDNNVEFLNA